MNPADVAQSALPLASTDVSLIALFPAGSLDREGGSCSGCSLVRSGCGAIAIDKTFLYARTKARHGSLSNRRSGSGQSIEELYRALSAKPDAIDGGLFRRGDARNGNGRSKGPGAILRRAFRCGSRRS